MSGGRAYYNEIDPYAAQWLRNLIAAGHIAAGDVDERSIVDVRADDLRGYTQCHFFAGIGGWSLALRLAGWPDDRPVWTGSCPCQPFSAAGKQRGSDDERHLWPAFFRLIRECRPASVFGEQVAGAAGLAWLDHVCADLEGAGYAAAAADLCAAGVGAPHIRQRLYWVAHAADIGSDGRSDVGRTRAHGEPKRIVWRESERRCNDGSMAHAERRPAERWGHDLAAAPGGDEEEARQRQRVWVELGAGGNASALAHNHPPGFGERRLAELLDGQRAPQRHHADGRGPDGVALGDATSPRPQGREQPGQRADAQREAAERAGAAGGVGNTHSKREGAQPGVSRWPAVERTGSLDPWSDLDWIECSDGKARPTQPGLFPLAHGIPNRVGRLRAFGNAIVPQVAAVFVMANMESDPC